MTNFAPARQRASALRALRLPLLLLVFFCGGCASVPPPPPVAKSDLPLFDLNQYESVQDRVGQSPETTVVVAISGGGFRAANLGLGALLAMEQVKLTIDGRETNLLAEVDYFTTVSGGGYAPGLYLQGLLSTPAEARQAFRLDEYLRRVKDGSRIESDRLPSVQKTLFWRIAGYLFYPGVIGGNLDRGDMLQNRLDTTILKRGSCDEASFRAGNFCSWTLDDVFKPRGSGEPPTTPYWITNATNYTNGEIFSFTPDNLCSRDVVEYKHQLEDVSTFCPDEVGASSVHPLARGVPLALGMRTSSNFPVGLPATTLKVKGGYSIQLSDGGQADNLAFYSALEILFQESQASRSRPKVDGTAPKRILVLIDAFKGSLGNSEASAGSPNFAQAALRSPSLPMDALRSRIRASVSQLGIDRRSEVDSVLMDQNLAVAYINIDQEDYARDVGTTLWLDEEKQDRLIEAGFRQAYAVLENGCEKLFHLRTIDISINCDESAGGRKVASNLGMIEFNSGLLDQRKRDLLSLRTAVIGDLATSVDNLQTSLEGELTRQLSADTFRKGAAEAEEALQQAYADRLVVAKRKAEVAVRAGQDFGSAARSFSALHNSLVRDPATTRENLEARQLACRSVKLYQFARFKPAIAPLGSKECQDIVVPATFNLPEEKFGVLLAGAESLAEICSKSWARLPTCRKISTLRNQALSALDIYATEARRPVNTTASQTTEDAEPPLPQCGMLDTLGESVRTIYLAGGSRIDPTITGGGAAASQLFEDDAAVLKEIAGLPRTYQDVKRRCGDLLFRTADRTASINTSLAAMKIAISNAQCVLTRYPKEFEQSPTRFQTRATELFEGSSTDAFCHGRITALPKLNRREASSSQASN